MARFMISGSNSGRARTPREISDVASSLISGFGATGGAVTVDIYSSLSFATLKQFAIEHLEMLHDGT